MSTPAEVRALNEELFRQLATPGRHREAADAVNEFTRLLVDVGRGVRVGLVPFSGRIYEDAVPDITLATYANPFMWGRPSHVLDMPDPVRMRTLRAMILVWSRKCHSEVSPQPAG